MARYDAAVLDEIRGAVDIVEVVGRVVNLKKAGVNWKGLCPFHAEKTPSFMVNPQKRIFHCFGCGVGGDVFGFVMRQDRLSFPEVVRALALSAGVVLPEERGAEGESSGREELYRVMDLAARYYEEALWNAAGTEARAYLDKRGIDATVARRFRLGYAPEGWDGLLRFMRAERVDEEALARAGLVVPRQGGGVYDRFRHRLLFTIHDLQGRVVALGGRAFGDEQPKYLNSPETPLYTKGRLLYAADVARDTMRARNRALLVEGYVDCLMAHQYGFTETVAALGTAFTAEQLALLRRHCEEVITFFDADAAGQKAAERAEELLEPSAAGLVWGVNRTGSFEGAGTLRVKVALLPAGHDPDTFLRAEGAEAFAERIAGARSLLGYALDRVVSEPGGGSRARSGAFARAALMLAKVADAEEAATLSREAAVKLGVDPTQLWIEARRLQDALRKPISPAPSRPATSASVVERDLVALLVHDPASRAALLPLVQDADLAHESSRAIVEALRQRPDAPAESLMADLPDEAARSALAALLVDEERHVVPGALEQFRARLERQRRLRSVREVSRGIAEAQARGDAAATLVGDLRRLEQESREVYWSSGADRSAKNPEDHQGVHTHD